MMRDRGNWQGVLDDKFDGDLCSSVGLSLPLERRDVRVDEANQRNGIENGIRGDKSSLLYLVYLSNGS